MSFIISNMSLIDKSSCCCLLVSYGITYVIHTLSLNNVHEQLLHLSYKDHHLDWFLH